MLKSGLDRETTPSDQLRVIAYDLGTPPRSSSVVVTVTISDVNDNRPKFTNASYSADLPENTPLGASVVTISALDDDAGSNGTVTYRIKSGNDDGKFLLDGQTGLLTLAGSLDRETVSSYQLVAMAMDGGTPSLSSNVTIAIKVLDVNDESPVFSQPAYSTSVSEASQTGLRILQFVAQDKDIGSNAEISYRLTSGHTSGVFNLNSTSGWMTLAQSLDRETKAHYAMSVTAFDHGSPQQSTTVDVNVTVLDVNDNAPIFGRSAYTIRISEGVQPPVVMDTITASDADAGSNGSVSLTLNISSADSKLFSLSSRSGLLSLISSLDRETAARHDFFVSATDAGSPPKTSSAAVQVIVQDINDNSPMFLQSDFEARVLENSTVGSFVTSVVATDHDTGSNAALSYSIKNTDNSSPVLFRITDTGIVQLAAKLDAETALVHLLNISVHDNGTPTRSSSASLNVTVLDHNDNAPALVPQQTTITFQEAGPAVDFAADISATDADLSNALVSGAVTLAGTITKMSPTHGLECTQQVQASAKLALCGIASSLDFLASAQLRGAPHLDSNGVLSLDGASQFGQVDGTTPGLDVTKTFTLTAWLTTNQSSAYVLSRTSGSGVNMEHFFTLHFENGLQRVVFLYKQPGVAGQRSQVEVIFQLPAQLPSGWHHISLVVNVPNAWLFVDGGGASPPSQVKFWKRESDGSLTQQSSAMLPSPLDIATTSIPLLIGTLSDPVVSGFKGQIAGLSLSNMSVAVSQLACVSGCDEWLIPPTQVTAGVSVSRDHGGRQLVITGSADVNTYTSVLQAMQYINRQDEPSLATRSISLSISDGVFSSNTAVTLVAMTGINDNAPRLDLDTSDGNSSVDFSTTFVENGAAVKVTGRAVSLSDRDAGSQLQLINITVGNPLDGNNERLSASSSGMITIHFLSTYNIQLVGPAPAAQFEAVLSSLAYQNTAPEPSAPNSRQVRFVASDGNFSSPPATCFVTIQHVNDAPVLDLGGNTGFAALFVEGGGAVPLASNTTSRLFDVDNQLIASLEIQQVSPPDGSHERLNFSTAGTNISALQSGGRLVFTGPASARDFLTVLQSVTYINTKPIAPTAGDRLVTFVASDGLLLSNVAFVVVTVETINNPPQLDVSGAGVTASFSTTFTEGHNGVSVVSSSASIIDADSSQVVNASIRLSSTPDGQLEGLRLNTTSSTVSAVYDQVQGELRLHGASSKAEYVRLLQNAIYYNGDDDPDTRLRQITMFVFDNGGQRSNVGTTFVTCVSVNDPPKLTISSLPVVKVSYTEGLPPVAIVNSSAVRITDPDNTGVSAVRVHLSGILDGINEEITSTSTLLGITKSVTQGSSFMTVLFTFQPSLSHAAVQLFISSLRYVNRAPEPNATAERQIRLSVSDGQLFSNEAYVDVSIQLVNDNLPLFTETSYPAVSVSESSGNGTTVLQVSASDADGDSITYSILSAVPFAIDSANGRLTVDGRLDRETTASYSFFVKAVETSDSSRSSTASVHINIADINDNTPAFIPPSLQVNVSESAPLQQLVVTVFAQDEDAGSNGSVSYRLKSGNIGSVFELQASTGNLLVVKSLDRETQPVYTLDVEASDSGQPPLSSDSLITVMVLDANDNTPQFEKAVYQEDLSEVCLAELGCVCCFNVVVVCGGAVFCVFLLLFVAVCCCCHSYNIVMFRSCFLKYKYV